MPVCNMFRNAYSDILDYFCYVAIFSLCCCLLTCWMICAARSRPTPVSGSMNIYNKQLFQLNKPYDRSIECWWSDRDENQVIIMNTLTNTYFSYFLPCSSWPLQWTRHRFARVLWSIHVESEEQPVKKRSYFWNNMI